MKKTIFRVMFGIAMFTTLIFGGVAVWQLLTLRGNLERISGESSVQIRRVSEEAISQQVSARLYENSYMNANEADQVFSNLAKAVSLIAKSAEDIYDEPSGYGVSSVLEPDMSMVGQGIVAQVVYSAQADRTAPSLEEELALLGNLKGNLTSLYSQFPQLASAYIATDSGFMIMAEPVSESRFGEDGAVLPFEAKERPWYIGAAETKQTYFTGVVQDADNGGYGLICAVPVLRGDKVVAVAGAGMMLDAVEELVLAADLSDSGISCIMNNEGSVIFSTSTEGTLQTDDGSGRDVRETGGAELAALVDDALSGNNGVTQMALDGAPSYIAYAPMETVGWTFLSVLPEDTVLEPTVALANALDESNEERTKELNGSLQSTFLILLFDVIFVILVITVLSEIFSKRLVLPITTLTESVKGLQGDSLEFVWELEAKDEIQTLAESFGSMTERMKSYIYHIQEITAEKERIGAELELATKIQADMLPNIFPAFPEREDFDIFASMTPAKEVGGDFYDFFLIDDDHVGLVMADVSGKGVPAALFMMMAKILVNNFTMMAGPDASPAEVLGQVNDTVCKNNKEEMFVTVWLGILTISTGHMVAANAGHEYPILKKADGEFELMMDKHGFVIGGMEGMIYSDYEFTLEKGGALFVYTDGVVEATDAHDELYGADRTLEALNEVKDASPKELLTHVKASVDAFVGEAPQFDDLTMLAVKLEER